MTRHHGDHYRSKGRGKKKPKRPQLPSKPHLVLIKKPPLSMARYKPPPTLPKALREAEPIPWVGRTPQSFEGEFVRDDWFEETVVRAPAHAVSGDIVLAVNPKTNRLGLLVLGCRANATADSTLWTWEWTGLARPADSAFSKPRSAFTAAELKELRTPPKPKKRRLKAMPKLKL